MNRIVAVQESRTCGNGSQIEIQKPGG